ncbi:MAG: Gfo/Idh/MocA family oxidoreductase [Spirochaetales bacterium]|nr:MAG: Gfo/Idh/MocA family oxidoreductase [Spirochaetales bacterium]
MSRERPDVVLIGIGGYGQSYVQWMEQYHGVTKGEICGVVDPVARKSPQWQGLHDAGVPIFDTLEEYLNQGGMADLAVVASPIAFHADQTCGALDAGMNVLCEKPIAATVQDVRRMISARDRAGRFLEVGYQWSFTDAIQSLKADILAGRLGRPKRFAALVLWPRTSSYYQRNSWAARKTDSAGRWVLDSPVSNATAHYLHNMLFLSGPAQNRSVTPVAITAECFRGNDIENFDTACCRVETAEGAEILFYTSHCVEHRGDPGFRFEFENAIIDYSGVGTITARFSDGRTKEYGDPGVEQGKKLRVSLERIAADEPRPDICGPEAAMAHTLCVNGMQENPVGTLPADQLVTIERMPGDTLRYLPGLGDLMTRAYNEGSPGKRRVVSQVHSHRR